MSVEDYADDLSATVHYALETTRAVAICPFHSEVSIRIGDDAAESHAFERAKRIVRDDLGDARPQTRIRKTAQQGSRWGVPTLRATLNGLGNAIGKFDTTFASAHSSRINLQHDHQA